jgi:CDP-glycerol glycerophosphotransferase
MPGRISVIVPVYNVEAYLETCLESIAQQSVSDLEVVMVDDGSTDESAKIAARFAQRDPRFKLVHQQNAGLGAARNTGVPHATGEFLAFVDSDDVVPRHAYELLLGALDRTGSDFASGNVMRLTPFGMGKAGFVGRVFDRSRLKTHITRFPALVNDRTAWNKLFRRSFWDEHGFRFPQGVYYEDIPVTLPAHYLARSVDLVGEPVYLWRVREGSDLSITQRRTEPKALRDRVSAVDHVSRFLAEQKFFVSKAVYDRSAVGQDLRFFLDVLPSADPEYRRLFLDLVNAFIDGAHEWCLEQPLAIDRVKWQLVRRRALPELLEVLRFEDEELPVKPAVRGRGGRWYGDYPYRSDERLRLPASAYRLEDELVPVSQIDDVSWDGDALRIEGYAYISMIGAPTQDFQTVEVLARRLGWRRKKIRLETVAVHRPDVTTAAAQEFASLDWSGFVATLDTAQLKRGERWGDGTWEIGIRIRAGGVTRTSWRSDFRELGTVPEAALSLEDGTRVRAGLGFGGILGIQVQRAPVAVRSLIFDERALQLEGVASGGSRRALTLHLSRRGGAWTLDYPVHVDRAQRPAAFLARVPLADLLGEVGVADAAAHVEEQPDGVVWDVYFSNGTGLKPLLLEEAAPESTWTLNGREVAVRRGRVGNITLAERYFRPMVTSARWTPDGALRLEGVFRCPAEDYELRLTARGRAETHAVPLELDMESARFAAEVPVASMRSVSGLLPLAEGLWYLLVARAGDPRDSGASVGLAPELDALPAEGEDGLKRVRFGVLAGGAACVAVEQDLTDEERGGFSQRRLRATTYAANRSAPLRDAVVYDCFGGRGYGDNPRALHEELVRRGARFEHLWIVRDGAFAVPETAVPLRHGSREYHEALARSRYVVANDYWPPWFERREGQACVQMWHGSPLKRGGHELAERPRSFRAYRRVLSQSAANWECVLSAGPFATASLRRAFPLAGEVLETGLPRTDRLVHPERERLAAEVKERLGVAGRRVVLYEPTYRDQLEYRSGARITQLRNLPTYRGLPGPEDRYRAGPLLDVAALGAALGDEYAVLFRMHRRVADAMPAEAQPYAIDVSAYPDEMDLLLAADVLVTDYASSIFDFAATGKPMVFFVPDLEDFRDEIRGLTIDLEEQAPGPLLRTTDEVLEALKAPDAARSEHERRYEQFVAAYCSLADGRASARVVERVFGV